MWKIDNSPIEVFTEKGNYIMKLCQNFERCGEYLLVRYKKTPALCDECLHQRKIQREKKRRYMKKYMQSEYFREVRRRSARKTRQELKNEKQRAIRKLRNKYNLQENIQAIKHELKENTMMFEKGKLSRDEAEIDRFQGFLNEYEAIKAKYRL